MTIDPVTGLRAGPNCWSDSLRVEYFLIGTEPTMECPRPSIF
jgi:hypothetical protein